MPNSAPTSAAEVLERATAIAGLTLEQVAQQLNSEVPRNFLREKGWVGQLLEQQLGATAGSKAEPDFPQLGIELKTIPVDSEGRPRESTFVCRIPLLEIAKEQWHTSLVYRKLSHVLWIPIQAEPQIPIEQRRIGMPLLWQPSNDELQVLQEDWEEVVDMIAMGKIAEISSRLGEYLQVRPKAANSKALTSVIDANGNQTQTLPRGFYLRPGFTLGILRRHFACK